MRTMHHRLRDALEVTRDELRAAGPAPPPLQELLLYCQGFCAALDGHHRSEDRTLFPGIEAAHPGPVVLVTHGHVIQIGMSLLRGHGARDIEWFDLPNGGIVNAPPPVPAT